MGIFFNYTRSIRYVPTSSTSGPFTIPAQINTEVSQIPGLEIVAVEVEEVEQQVLRVFGLKTGSIDEKPDVDVLEERPRPFEPADSVN